MAETLIAVSQQTIIDPPMVVSQDGLVITIETVLFDTRNQSAQRGWLYTRDFATAKLFPSRVAGTHSRMVGRSGWRPIIQSYVVWSEAKEQGFHELWSTSNLGARWAYGWSPDAIKILFTRAKQDSDDSEICVVNVDDTGLQKLTDGFNPKWSPDGRYIAFLRSPQDKVYELWVMELE